MTVMGHQSFFETEKSPQTRMNTKKNVPDSKIRHIIWWGMMDSDHRSRKTTDLQSAPFGHSGIPPHKARVTIPRLLGLVKRPPAIFPPKNPRYSPATRPALFFYTRYFKTGCFLVYYTRPGSGHKKRGLPICAGFAGLQARSPGGKRSSGRWPIGSPTAGRIPKDTIWMGPSPWPSAA